MAGLNICFINMNGFGAAFKQKMIISSFTTLDFYIVLLQEKHVKNIRDAKKLPKGWDGLALCSIGADMSRDVGILLSWQLSNYSYDHSGMAGSGHGGI